MMSNQTHIEIDTRIKQINQKFKQECTRIRIIRRGNKLSLRGTFPNKYIKGGRWKQARIPLGLDATQQGLELAIPKAREVYEHIRTGKHSRETILSFAKNSVHDIVLKDISIETSAKAEYQVSLDKRADIYDIREGWLWEIKSGKASARSVGQLYEYMQLASVTRGVLVAESFCITAKTLVQELMFFGYEIQLKEYRVKRYD